MQGQKGFMQVGNVNVVTTSNTGLPVEHWADRCVEKIVYVADDKDSVIKEQAIAFREDVRQVVLIYMKNAIKSDRTTLYNMLLKQGEPKMAEILRRL